jgi:hypothetical protein
MKLRVSDVSHVSGFPLHTLPPSRVFCNSANH